MSLPAVARIRSAALQNNLERARAAAPGSPVLAVIKADAYGHGLEHVITGLESADAFGVARVGEALRLRELQVRHPIVVMSEDVGLDEIDAAREHDLSLVLHNEAQVEVLARGARGPVPTIWLKIDSGMGRLGLAPERCEWALQCLRNCLSVTRDPVLMTHLACADETDNSATEAQLQRFGDAIGNWTGDVSIANSAGILGWPDALTSDGQLGYAGRNWLRPGLMLYGVSPFPGQAPADNGLEPVMTLQARLIDVRELPGGSRVGYGGDWEAPRDSRIGVVNIGYADGYPWRIPGGTPAEVAGAKVPVVGRISMDMVSIDLTDLPQAKVGDVVTLWGDSPQVGELAAAAGTSPYELLTGVGNRVERISE
jgi:alanine racemase